MPGTKGNYLQQIDGVVVYSGAVRTPSKIVGLCIALFLLLSHACQAAWKDPSKHKIRFIDVEPGVKLEVLDWGGKGPAILLLAGHGDTGHVFDDFAPSLTDRFHVVALTRRGFGASSQPQQGYDLRHLVEDMNKVITALHLDHVNLVGHSIAGDEITRFTIDYPAKVGKLVYLEAAYDRVEAQKLESRFPKMPPAPSSDRETGTPKDVQAFIARSEILMPESEIRATRVFGADGQYVRPVTPDTIVHSVAVMVEHPDYAAIHAPIMAIYAVYTAPGQLVPKYNTANPETQAAINQIFTMWQSFATEQRKLLRDSAPNANVVEVAGASHYVFLSNRDQVLREIHSFLMAP